MKCASCHKPLAATATAARPTAATPAPLLAIAPKNVDLRPASHFCADCHADAHAGQLGAHPDQGTCERCHNDAGWKPSTYTVAAHAALRVTLDGRHGTIPCAACHGMSRPGLTSPARPESFGTAHVMLKVPEIECVSCHVDPHAGRYSPGSAFAPANGCRSCHDQRSFHPSLIDVAAHARYSFPLEGGHRAAPCIACHAEMKKAPATSTLKLSAKGVQPMPFTQRRATTCVSCHENPHGPQFTTRKDKGACESCHGVDAFAPASRFDHERDAAFSLKGAHVKVPCAGCHKPATAAAGAPAMPKYVVYKGIPAKCENCHAGKGPGGLQ